jgi:hypothetical protein
MNKKEIEKIKRLKKEAWNNRQRFTGMDTEKRITFAYHFGEFEAYRRVLNLIKK